MSISPANPAPLHEAQPDKHALPANALNGLRVDPDCPLELCQEVAAAIEAINAKGEVKPGTCWWAGRDDLLSPTWRARRKEAQR